VFALSDSIPAAFAGLIAQAGQPVAAAEQAAKATGAPGWLLFIAFLAVIGLPFGLAWLISRALRMPEVMTRIGVVLLAATIGVSPFVWNVVVGTTVEGLSAGESLRRSIKLGVDLAGGTNLVYQVVETKEKPLTNQVLDNMVGSIIKRINPAGTEEVTVRRVGRDRIEIIVPGADPEKVRRIKDAITRLGSLEFDLLANREDHANLIQAAQALPGTEKNVRQGGRIVAAWKSVAKGPDGTWKLDFAPATRYVDRKGQIIDAPPKGSTEGIDKQVLLVIQPTERQVTGEFLKSAGPTRDENGQPAVSFNFDSRGGSRFARLTGENQPRADGFKRQLAILLDDQVHSAPSINSTISTNGIITGRFTQEEVQELVNVLNAGALEVPIVQTPVSEYTISPLLGEDTIRKAVWAMLVSGVFVLTVTAGYYLLAGMVADFCLLLNLLLLLGTMSFIDATFTLPGLAGVVLSVAMAVDANVLIYERMREEFERGSSFRLAVHNGFDRAFSAIFDGHITTLITAVILFMIGTDAVRGFAVSLFIGVVLSLFTALYVGRLLFDILERKRVVRRLKMFRMFAQPNIDFLKYKVPAVVISVLLIVVGMGMFAYRGAKMLDIDFLGGTMVTFQLEEPTTSTKVRDVLDDVPGLKGNVSVERLVLFNEARTGEGRRFRVRTTMKDSKAGAGQESGQGAAPAKTGQPSVAQSISQAFEKAGMEVRRITVKAGEVTPIPGQAAEGSFSGGWQANLSLGTTKSGERQELNADTMAAYVANRLAEIKQGDRPKYEKTNELVRVVGTAGSGLKAKENEVKTFSDFRVEVSPVVERADLEATLKAVEDYMASHPVFDEVNSFDTSVAGEMQQTALLAILASWVAIIGYLWFRFQDLFFGLAAVIAIVHDVLITIGLLALASYAGGPLGINWLGLEEFKINLPMVASILTLIGYSVNDTIVVFDRIREVRGKNPMLSDSMVNLSVNQTLSRTLLTSVTTLIVCVVLYFFGGEGIHGFTFILAVGIIVGTFSSIFVASPVLLWLAGRKREKAVMAMPSRQPALR
jgi:SecD/SecF fusion protein